MPSVSYFASAPGPDSCLILVNQMPQAVYRRYPLPAMTTTSQGRITIRLDVLGPLELRREPGGKMDVPMSASARYVLAVMATTTTYDRRQLITMLWPDDARNYGVYKARRALNDRLSKALLDARRAVKLRRTDGFLKLTSACLDRVEDDAVVVLSDFADFHALAESDNRIDWERALALVRGVFAAGLPEDDTQTDWLEDERKSQRKDIMEILARLYPDGKSAELDGLCKDVLHGRYRQSRLASFPVKPTAPSPTQLKSDSSIDRGPIPNTVPSPTTRAPRVTPKRLVALLLACVASLAVTVALLSSAHGSLPPPGSIVNTWTGHASFRASRQTLPTEDGPEITVGTLFWACNKSLGATCSRYPLRPRQPVIARRGDLLDFWIRLYNPLPTPLPYLTLAMYWSYGQHSWEINTRLQFKWPNGEAVVPPISIYLSPGGLASSVYQLAYVPGSTVLTTPNPHVRYPLPNGIVHRDSIPEQLLVLGHLWPTYPLGGIGLADLGPPSSCSDCLSEYVRFVHFQVRVV
jgi:hypothetical protein